VSPSKWGKLRTTLTVDWYDGQPRAVEVASETAVWYHTGKPIVLLRWVLIRDPFGELESLALLCTTQAFAPHRIVALFIQRWQVEVTFEEARAHLGVETQRQWSDLAITRTTPALLGLFSWVTLAAHVLQTEAPIPVRGAAWYAKSLPTFSDAIALVRQHLWPCSQTFCMSSFDTDVVKVPKSLFLRLVDTDLAPF
jgi:hypothetical protein